MSSTITPRLASTSKCSSPKSSPTGPTTRTSVKKLAAREKWTAEPPSIRSRSPNGVRTESNAIDPTTVRDISGLAKGSGSDPHPGRGAEEVRGMFLDDEGYSDRGIRRAREVQARRAARPGAERRSGRRRRRPLGDQLRGHPRDPQRLPR